MEFVWIIILIFAILSRLSENSKKQAQKRARDSRAAARKVPEEVKKNLGTDDYPGTQKSGIPQYSPGQDAQEIFDLFTGKTKPLNSTSEPEPVIDQEVMEGEFSENGSSSEGTKQEENSYREYKVPEEEEIQDMTEMQELTGEETEKQSVSLNKSGIFPGLDDATKGIIWHEVLDRPRKLPGSVSGGIRK